MAEILNFLRSVQKKERRKKDELQMFQNLRFGNLKMCFFPNIENLRNSIHSRIKDAEYSKITSYIFCSKIFQIFFLNIIHFMGGGYIHIHSQGTCSPIKTFNSKLSLRSCVCGNMSPDKNGPTGKSFRRKIQSTIKSRFKRHWEGQKEFSFSFSQY